VKTQWAKLLSEAVAAGVERVPTGWKTSAQIAVETGKSRRVASANIKTLVESGRVEVRTFTIKTGQLTRKVPHYRAG
jgi:hypothetical protein